MTRVLIAVDGSELDDRLGETARNLFPDCDLYAINVQERGHSEMYPVARGAVYQYPPVVAGGVAPVVLEPEHNDEPDDRRRAVARDVAIEASPSDATPIGEIGDPPEMILAAAQRHRADVLVVGSRDRGWWSTLLRPSVSDGVLEHAPVPVLVVRSAGAPIDGADHG